MLHNAVGGRRVSDFPKTNCFEDERVAFPSRGVMEYGLLKRHEKVHSEFVRNRVL